MSDRPGRTLTPAEAIEIGLREWGRGKGRAVGEVGCILLALREAGFVVACAECNSSTSGIHYVGCSMTAPARNDQ